MPEPQNKAQIAKNVKPLLDELHLTFRADENERSPLFRQMEGYKNWRQNQMAIGDDPALKQYKHFGGKLLRVAAYYLDNSGTEKAAKSNEALYQSISTEEGMRAFANRVARDILRADLRTSFFTGTPEEAARIYFDNPLECELGWVCQDLLTDAGDMLDPAVARAVRDRAQVFQGLGTLSAGVEVVGNSFYPLIDGITPEVLEKSGELEDGEFYENPAFAGNTDLKALEIYLLKASNYRKMVTDPQKAINEAGIAFLEKYKVTPTSVFADENGNSIDCMTAIMKYARNEKVTVTELPTREELKKAGKEGPSRDVIENLVAYTEAEKPMHGPTAENPALFNQFGKEALGAQGKGLTEEYRRLATVMDGATYRFAIASDEFKGIRRELHRLGDGETVPNRDESRASMEKILEFANTYIKNKQGLTLKPREQRRLDAVMAVRDSLTPRLNLLKTVEAGAKAQHEASYNATGEAARGVQASLENQTDMHVNTVEQKIAACYEDALQHVNEDTAIGDLATTVSDTLNDLRAYAVNPACDPEKTGAPYREDFGNKMAQMALFGVLLRERRNAADNALCPMGERLNELRDLPPKWKAMMDTVASTAAVKRAVIAIRENPASAVDWIGKNGTGKLVDMIIREAAPREFHPGPNPNAKQPDAPANRPPVK